jgi:hypothetical protein
VSYLRLSIYTSVSVSYPPTKCSFSRRFRWRSLARPSYSEPRAPYIVTMVLLVVVLVVVLLVVTEVAVLRLRLAH